MKISENKDRHFYLSVRDLPEWTLLWNYLREENYFLPVDLQADDLPPYSVVRIDPDLFAVSSVRPFEMAVAATHKTFSLRAQDFFAIRRTQKPILLHVPHASLTLPESFLTEQKILIPLEEIDLLNRKVTDLYADELFPTKDYPTIAAEFSRLYCDVERYEEKRREPMEKYGMGVVYRKTLEGTVFVRRNEDYAFFTKVRAYYPHHRRLTAAAKYMLDRFGSLLLLDCHTYSDDTVLPKKQRNNPDFCIGHNGDAPSKKVAEKIASNLDSLGYSVAINEPYRGSIVPNNLTKSEQNALSSVMIEVHRRLYLNGFQKSNSFSTEQKKLAEIISRQVPSTLPKRGR